MKNLTNKKDYLQLVKSFPRLGDLIEGTVIEIGRNEIYLDINGLTTGIVRGPELFDESGEFSNLKKGDKVFATVIDLENEKGLIDLSFRQASHKKAWNNLEEISKNKNLLSVKITEANKGGLIVYAGKIQGFLPVSQLKPDHYPRVEEGNKNRILEKLKEFVGQEMKVKIITIDEKTGKLIVSEKETSTTEKKLASKYKIGDVVEGKISGLVDFGAFITFGKDQEGLVHISELAWQRIDHPQDVVKIGDKIKAEIIGITDDGKISLSIRRLLKDPWKTVKEKYKIGQIIDGKILKINPFGLFVEIDPDIHGLAHISELSDKPIKDASCVAQMGETLKFKIVSIEPDDHRLGLSLIKKNK
ncbi:MAG: S1 RNA-binding domain-containing protein [Patescibacteria group bacterium]|jgi:ribosomal protein S1|nr:S1 RNA-binding domain-containing protein [Patescibacteria group bacterium]